MNQLRGLLRDTWWLWLLVFGAAIVMGVLVTWIYYLLIPVLLVTMVYFALMRYDKEGRNIGDSGDSFGR